MKVKSTDSRLEKLENLTDYMKFYIFRDKSDISKFKTEWLLLIQFKAAYVEISKIKALKKIIENYLKINFDKEIAKIYTKYLTRENFTHIVYSCVGKNHTHK